MSDELPELKVAPPGPRSRALAARLAAVESPAFEARRDARATRSGAEQSSIVYERGAGSNVWDVDGNRYVDLTAGFGALVLGYAPSKAITPGLPVASAAVLSAHVTASAPESPSMTRAPGSGKSAAIASHACTFASEA